MAKAKIITLMFHRVNNPNARLHLAQFAQYLDYLVNHFPIVLPGENPSQEGLAICLTFDDAYYDFYHDVYPLLLKYQIKALLAVPVKYIAKETSLSSKERLSLPTEPHQEGLFCTWQELREMAQSGQVMMASHGYAHIAHTDKNINLKQEIIGSKQQLENELKVPINHFVYPFGRITRRTHQKVRQIYDYGIRIGSALNIGWDHSRQFIYRMDATPLWTAQRPITKALIYKLTFKYWRNRIRLI